MLFEDDAVLTVHAKEEMQRILEKLLKSYQKASLTISLKKTNNIQG